MALCDRDDAGAVVSLSMGEPFLDLHERSRRRWLVSAPPPLVLVNPPERSRRYHDGEHDDEATQLSVLGSKGEWKVVSTDKTHWIAIDLGAVRCVHAIVLQCGALERSFSGWVTKLQVHHAMQAQVPSEDTEWTALERQLHTNCTSDPAREHRLELREPLWARHIKLTPQGWKVAGVLSTGENLLPHISMRAGVLATHHRAEDAAHVEEIEPRLGAHPSLVTQRAAVLRSEPAGSALGCVFNLRRGCAVSSVPSVDSPMPPTDDLSILDARLPVDVRLLRVGTSGGVQAAESSPVIGIVLPSCMRGDCVLIESSTSPSGDACIGVVSDRERDAGFCSVWCYRADTQSREQLRLRPSRIVGGFAWDSSTFHMDMDNDESPPRAFDAPGAWAVQMLMSLGPPSSNTRPHRDFNEHVLWTDRWLNADEYLRPVAQGAASAGATAIGFTETCCAVFGTPPAACMNIEPMAEALAYCASRGARVALASDRLHAEAMGTVVSVEASTGRAIVSVDNTHTLRSFRVWATSHLGRLAPGGRRVSIGGAPRSLMRYLPLARMPTLPSDMAQASQIRYSSGDRLMVLRDGAFVDATVKAWLGAEYGNRHVLMTEGMDDELMLDLNEINHSPQRFTNMSKLLESRACYLDRVVADGREVEDAITGKRLLIEKQLLHLSMATGDDAVRPLSICGHAQFLHLAA